MREESDTGRAESVDQIRSGQVRDAAFVCALRERVRQLEATVELLQQDRAVMVREVEMLRARLGLPPGIGGRGEEAGDVRTLGGGRPAPAGLPL